ncbi:Pof6 interactor protein 1 [Zalerion maritima]|uniref:Pof6 interactor protein 1 n=1 Tax=Zalerion maritima TaxID=339359 RepID=A0AAD5S5U6_9PEZI|nr:Pof6 interactor protein 1 [Zalerion maritima]
MAAPDDGPSSGPAPDLSTPNIPAAAASSTSFAAVTATSHPELDLSKLNSLPAEQKEIHLIQFVANLTRHVLSLDPDDCTAQQFYLKKEIFQLITLPNPPPTRVVRNNLGRCLAHVFGKGDRKLLFDTINELVAIIAAGKSKSDSDGHVRHATVCCLGGVYGSAGDSAIGLHQLVCSTLVKVLKNSANNAGLRAAVFSALAKVVKIVATSLDEPVARDIWKQSRNYASTDKGFLVVISACRCLKSLVKHTQTFDSSSDFASLQSTMFKAFEYGSVQVRQAAADAFSEALVKGYIELAPGEAPPPPKVKRSKTNKSSKRSSIQPGSGIGGLDGDEIPSRPGSPAPSSRRSHELALSFSDILRLLSTQYTRTSTSNKARTAIGVCYGKVLKKLGETTVESHYIQIVENLSIDLLGHANLTNNRHRLLISRRITDTVLQDIVGKDILSEAGQIAAAKALINDVLKNYPQALKERPEPSKNTLCSSLGALSGLIRSLGSAANNFAEICRDGLLQHALQHPSYTVQVFVSSCLKMFVLACPQQLLNCMSVCMNSVGRELQLLGSGRNSPRRCIGFAHGLAASLSASPMRPLYGSVDVNSRVLTMATNLLKSSGQSELRMASTQIQVAWILIGGLMSLGPNFVKIHLSQLLLLWKNALPKPLGRDNTAHRSHLEASFLCHVRECALGSILAFLEFNSRLLTVDVSKRIATMLQSTTAFLRTLPPKKISEDVSQRLIPALQLQDLDMMVQRRVLQCYTKLVNISPAAGSEALLQSNLLTLAVTLFSDPESGSSNSLSASIAAAAGNFETIWDVADNVGFGVTSLLCGFKLRRLPGQHEASFEPSLSDEKAPEDAMSNLLLHPVCGTLEHDALLLYTHPMDDSRLLPDPASTEVVNMAIELFAFVFPLTPAKVQESILEQIATFLSAGSLDRDSGRKSAITVNIAVALVSTLKVASKETQSSSGDVTNIAVERLLQEIIGGFVIDQDQYVRSLGYGALARLCNTCGNAFTNHEIKHLVDTIVGNREPSARAGCAMALGTIQAKVGGMAAGYHLKTILGILMSLGNDPHPSVHFWALEAMSCAADAAALGFSPYVTGTLGMVSQLYMSDTHNPEVASAITMNLEVELSTVAALARCVDSLINVLGPDLQESNKTRELVFTIVALFQDEEEPQVQTASLICYEHLSMYAPGYVDFNDYVKLLQRCLSSESKYLRDSAVDGLYSLMKRDSNDVIAAADDGFEDQLWLALDNEPSHDGIRNIVSNWMRQTCLEDAAGWLQRFQGVLKMTRQKQADTTSANSKKSSAMPDLRDEEVAGFAAGEDGNDKAAQSEVEPLRWQVRTFSMSLLDEIFHLVNKDVITNGESRAQAALQNKIADIVRMAFSASTSSVLELRIWGLKIIGDVLKMFGKTPDPDFEEAMLLEQYQAQISSALTPAFAADSSPELAAEAVNVCAAFIATGIVTDVDRMGRILKTLVTALEKFAADSENAGIGDLKGLSSNAQVMVKMSVYSAWADLQVASSEQKYLLDVLKPHIRSLTPRWLDSLKEFARLRFEPDISMTLGPPSLSGSLDTIYAALNRETLLRFYQESWLRLVDAIASLIDQDSGFVFDALDGKESAAPAVNGQSKGGDINYRDEPVAFFFVLFGIAFEALATRSGLPDSLATHEQTLAILQALKKILRPSVAGISIYRENIFAEAMELFDRLVLTEGLDVQGVIVEISRALCVSHPSARKNTEAEGEELSSDIEQLFELTRIIVLVLSGLLPNLSESNQPVRHQMTEEGVLLVRTSLNALVDAAEVFPSVIKTDLHACIIHVLATILRTPSCQEVIVPQTLPMLKRFLISMMGSRKEGEEGMSKTDVQLQGYLRRMLSIYVQAQKREQPTDLACVKNSLLSLTILFTSGRNYFSASEPLVERYMEEVLDCLTDRMTAKIAANCIRSLLLNPHPTTADQTMHRFFLPRLVKFITDVSPSDPEGARTLVSQSLVQFVSAVSLPERRPVAMALVFPALLKRAADEGGEMEAAGEDAASLYKETSERFLELAALDQMAFKGIVAGLGEEQKTFFEKVLVSGRDSARDRRKSDDGGGEQPTIALKMDFGG